MKKINILLIGIIFSLVLVMAIKISTFNDGSTLKKIIFNNNENKTLNISFSRYVNITSATMNLSQSDNFNDLFDRENNDSLGNDWIVSNKTNIESLSLLNASILSNHLQIYDFSTYGGGGGAETNIQVYKYIKNITRIDFSFNMSNEHYGAGGRDYIEFLLKDSFNNSLINVHLIYDTTLLKLKYIDNLTNIITVSDNTWKQYHNLSIRNINISNHTYDIYLNDSLLKGNATFYNFTPVEISSFYFSTSESLMASIQIDNFTAYSEETYPENLYVSINNSKIWNFTGQFNQTNNKTLNFAATLNNALNNGKCSCLDCSVSGNNCTIPITFHSDASGILEVLDLDINYEPIPFVYLKEPGNSTYASSTNDFTCNSTDELDLKNTTLYIWNSTSIINNTEYRIISGTSNSSSYNITFPRTDTYYWNCLVYNNNSYSNWHEENYTLFVDITNPTITLNFPSNNSYLNNGTNIYFNYTPEHPDGIDTCQLWGNWTGSYIKNDTDVTISNLSINSFVKNISDGKYKYTVWCNSTSGNSMFSQYGNYTFGIDTILPIANNMTISTTASQTQFTFLSNITDTNLANCWYSIWSGSIPGFTNTSFTCNSLTTANAPGFGTYILFLFTNDSAGNFVQQNLSFTTSVTATISGGGGGSPSTTTIQEEPSKLFSLLNTNLENRLNLQLAKDSKRPREKTLVLINRAKKPITVKLSCDMTDVNKSSREIDVCAYVKFLNETLILNANEDTPTETTLYLYTPDYSNFGENYYFNVLATDISTKGYSKLSVSSKVNILSTILYKWSDRITFKSFDYPVFLVSIIVSTLILMLSIMVFQRANPKLILTGLLVGFALFFGTLLLFTLYLF